MTRRLIFTVDLDRDVNIEVDGSRAAGSMDRGQGTAPRFESAEKGLEILLDILHNYGIKATFFVEGHTAEVLDCSVLADHCVGFHGYDHEDMTKLGPDDLREVMEKGYSAVKDNLKAPTCFRAPFMQMSDQVYGELGRLGIKHDSSVYADPGKRPYEVSGVTEHPVAKGKDVRGKNIAAYLWPMHEGKREPSDYLSLARSVGDGDLVLGTHSWHMVESRDKGIMTWAEMEHNKKAVEQTLKLIIDEGFEPATIIE
jgi:hypothetical protein